MESILEETSLLPPTKTCSEELTHMLTFLDGQVSKSVHVVRRVASYLAKVAVAQKSFVEEVKKAAEVEKKKTEGLYKDDVMPAFIKCSELMQASMSDMISKHSTFSFHVRTDIISELEKFVRIAETKQSELMAEDQHAAAEVSRGLASLQVARTTARKAWADLCKAYTKSQNAKSTEKEIKKLTDKINKKLIPAVKASLEKFAAAQDAAISEQDVYEDVVQPKVIVGLEALERQRMQLLETCFARFAELFVTFIVPGNTHHSLIEDMQRLASTEKLEEVFAKWKVAHGTDPLYKSHKLTGNPIPCTAADFDSDAWIAEVPAVFVDDDEEEEDEAADDSKKASFRLTDMIRGKVSKKKRRYVQDGYDLDLTYIMPNILAMGFPAEGIAGQYRNNLKDVKRFFDQHHAGKYKLWNLCSELDYDHDKFEGRVERFGFDDHNPCSLKRIQGFCESVANWCENIDGNVASIHCKAGKGRTGFLISCFLLHLNDERWASAEDALMFFARKRTYNAQGVTIPSQKRFVKYYEMLLRQQRSQLSREGEYMRRADTPSLSGALKIPTSRPLHLRSVVVHGIPMGYSENYTFSLYQPDPSTHKMVEVFGTKDNTNAAFRIDHGKDLMMWTPAAFDDIKTDEVCPSLCTLNHTLKMRFFNSGKLDKIKESLFHFWFNTRMLPVCKRKTGVGGNTKVYYQLLLKKPNVDKARKDKHSATYRDNFCVELIFESNDEVADLDIPLEQLEQLDYEESFLTEQKHQVKPGASSLDDEKLDRPPSIPEATPSDDEMALGDAPPAVPEDLDALSEAPDAPDAAPDVPDDMDMAMSDDEDIDDLMDAPLVPKCSFTNSHTHTQAHKRH
jgi:phosphatidylinositol-3,4,5-trisphosphate 3-phosphatase/dual-specificity protein phosphatase PTEN